MMKAKEITIHRIVPNIPSENLEASKRFYLDFLHMNLVMDLSWILTFASNENPTAQINVMKTEGSEKVNNGLIFISIEVSDVEKMYERAISMKCIIKYPLRNESWGVSRFFVMDPNGATINLLQHIN